MQKIWSSKKADLIYSHYIRDRDKGLCYFCGKKGSQNSHFWGRGHSATRYIDDNCDYVCGGCHMRNEGSKQGRYRDMKIKQLGMKRYKELERLHYTTYPRSKAIQDLMNRINPPS